METYEYHTDWINDRLTDSLATEPLPVPNATNHLNTHAAERSE